LNRRLPSFFVVGAAKSGTTALWQYFQQHPDIFVTTDIGSKELGYFSNQYGVTDKEHYTSYFENASEEQLIGEVCHVYLTSSESAAWIKKDVPLSKIIIILRNPVRRAYSLYNWMTMHGYENITTFRKALDREGNRVKNKSSLHAFFQNYMYFTSGQYYHQVKRYIEVFGREKVLVFTHEEFNQNQFQKLNEVYDFLGVERVTDIEKRQVNKSRRVISIRLQFYLRRKFIEYKKNTNVRIIIQKLMILNTVSKRPKSLKPELYEELKDRYQEDVRLLSDLCGIDFNGFWFGKNV